jgi:hypothetical protein
VIASLDRRPRVFRVVYNYPNEHDRLLASGRAEPIAVAPRSWPSRPWAKDDVVVTYLLLPEGGRDALPGPAPQPDASLERLPAWRGPYDPGFHFG